MGRKESNQTNKHVRDINHMWYRGWWSKPASPETQDGMEETDREWLPKWAKKDYTKTTLTPTDQYDAENKCKQSFKMIGEK